MAGAGERTESTLTLVWSETGIRRLLDALAVSEGIGSDDLAHSPRMETRRKTKRNATKTNQCVALREAKSDPNLKLGGSPTRQQCTGSITEPITPSGNKLLGDAFMVGPILLDFACQVSLKPGRALDWTGHWREGIQHGHCPQEEGRESSLRSRRNAETRRPASSGCASYGSSRSRAPVTLHRPLLPLLRRTPLK